MLENNQQRQAVRHWNHADTMLYEYFLKRFDNRVRAYGADRMKASVEKLRADRQKMLQPKFHMLPSGIF